MSIQFSDTTGKAGLIQQLEQACGFPDGGISSSTVLLALFTGKVNIAQDEAFSLILRNNGWNVDDFNHTKDPFLTTPLVSGQRDYHFTTDSEGSIILDIYRVMVRQSATGPYKDLDVADIQDRNDPHAQTTFVDGINTQGVPRAYDKTGNGIFLDPIPNYASTDGLKIFINREAIRFATSDTTKISGLDSLCHDFLYLKPAYEYARDKGLQNMQTLFRDMQTSWNKIIMRYQSRERDRRKAMIPGRQNNK